MAPIDLVVEKFIASLNGDTDNRHSEDAEVECSESESTIINVPIWATPEVGQYKFAQIVSRVVLSRFTPTKRYVRRLLTRYVAKIEREAGVEIEDETLAGLIAEHAFSPSRSFASSAATSGGGGLAGGDVPDPNAYGCVSFAIPKSNGTAVAESSCSVISDNIVGVRVYPHHNDVGVRRLWEAGGALAEYLLTFPELIKGRVVLELGAGVGFTGIVAAGICAPKCLYLTDYTDTCLENMRHNIDFNADWLQRQGVYVETMENVMSKRRGNVLTCGYLEWSEYSNANDSLFAVSDAEILLAADVVYDVLYIPNLVRTVKRLLQEGKKTDNAETADTPHFERKAIFATTFRNAETFFLFTSELRNEGIKCEYTDTQTMKNLAQIFPCYFNQPREDVRICTMMA